MIGRALLRRGIRIAGLVPDPPPIDPPLTGDFSSTRRYVPRFTLPVGTTYNPATGLIEGDSVSRAYTPPANEVLLADQGSEAANYAVLQTTLINAGSDAVRIRLAPTTTSWGDNFRVPAHNRVGVGLYLEPAGVKDGSLSMSGRCPLSKAGLAKFRLDPTSGRGTNPNGNPETRSCLHMAAGTQGVTLVGLDLAYDLAWAATLPDVNGTAPVSQTGTQAGLISMVGETTGKVHHIRVIHCSVQGSGIKPATRGMRLDGSHILLADSTIDNIGYRGFDSVGFFATDGSGPYQLENNYIAVHHGENWMFGGGNTSAPDQQSSDVVVRRNHFDFPLRWQAIGLETKNLGEFKHVTRAAVTRNRFTNGRMTNYDGQAYALVIKNVAQPPGADTWNRVQDVYVGLNEFVDCSQVLGIGGDFNVLDATEEIDFVQNRAYFTAPTTGFYPQANASTAQFSLSGSTDRQRQKDLRFRFNSLPAPKAISQYRRFFFDAGPQTNPRAIGFQVVGNVLAVEEPVSIEGGDNYMEGYFARNGGGFNATNAWNSITDRVNCAWESNAVIGSDASRVRVNLIPGDIGYASFAAAGIVNNQLRTQPGSPLLTADTDGGMIGCNHALLDAALAGV